ncbi:MAG: biosynthetic-type acetolactate synthase large subunit [Deltaproteobacteria bacterium]|nr:MAG: biosynthetic-type acetolactate synthase large subunit [Deltaproteobacteria bacterium]
MPEKMTGAQILLKTLTDLGVDSIFGYPGGVLLYLYDEIYKQDKIKHYLVRHEQGATHMADAYGRVTGKPGVCLATSGPGATNTVTGLATAMLDSVPMLCITGQVPVNLIGNDAFQEADIVGITRPCTKHNYLVKDVKDLERILHQAYYIASTGRPGPVLVDVPKDVTLATAEYQGIKEVSLRGYNPGKVPTAGPMEEAIELIYQSKRPVLYMGGGVVASGASELVRQFAEKLNLPVGITLMGLGGFPGNHDLSMGMIGMHGGYWANMAMNNADLLIALGPRFDDRVTGDLKKFATGAKKIHLDVDASSIGKNVAVDVGLVGDAKDVLQKLLAIVDKDPKRTKAYYDSVSPWHVQIKKWKEEHPIYYPQDMEGELRPQYVIQKIYDVTQGKTIITTDVGQHQMWTAQIFPFIQPRKWCTSGGLGTMGYGLPAAIGAQVAYPNETVFCISGDGSIQMNIQEMATAVQYNLPVKTAIINNGYLGMVRQWQEYFYGRRYSESDLKTAMPDFVKLAEAYGAVGFVCNKPKDVEGVLLESIKVKKPVLIDFQVAEGENVLPMVPAGKALDDMLLA